MQLTRFDRWLRERFVNETHVYTLRPPAEVPAGIRHELMPETAASKYRHRFIARRSKQADALITRLKDDNQMFTTRVVERKAWFVPYLAPKEKSVTWWIAWKILATVCVFFVLGWLKSIWDNPELRAQIIDAVKILKE
jgi:hypothetical protein